MGGDLRVNVLDPCILIGDVFEQLAMMRDESVHCVVTSPPYWALRDYGTGDWRGGDECCAHARPITNMNFGFNERWGQGAGDRKQERKSEQQYGQTCEKCGAERVDQQLGLERVPDCQGWATGEPCDECFICRMVAVFREVRRVLRPDGTVWLNIGDSYASKTRGSDAGWDKSRLSNPGSVQKRQAASLRKTGERHRGKEVGLKEKDLVGIPWSLAFALRADGWWLRRDNIWAKRNPMPESTQDRTTSAHEYVFTLAKSARYFFDGDAIREPAAWERWGDQTVPKHNGTATKTGWMQPRTIADLRALAKMPAGWSTLEGAHGSIHPHGRDKGHRKTFRGGGAYVNNHAFQDGADVENDSVGNDLGGHLGRNKRSVWEEPDDHEELAAHLAELFLECLRAGDSLADTVWSIATEPFGEAHFATFPTRLVEPCVKAGTSERGVCPDCEAPWERVISIDYERAHGHGEHSRTGKRRDMRRDATSNGNGGGGMPRLDKLVETTGWRPTCACYDDLYRARSPRPRASKRWQNLTWWERARARAGDPSWTTTPAVVLDPFAGACTTLLVARRLNRASVGIELNEEYAELGRRRLERWWDKPRTRPTPVPAGQLLLLAEGGDDG